MKQSIGIYEVLKDFYNISGIRVSIHDTEFNEIYSYPSALSPYCRFIQEYGILKKACLKDDAAAFKTVQKTGEVYVYKCSRGLYEAVAPIYHYGVLSGYLMMGQICSSDEASLEYLRRQAFELTKDPEQSARLAASVKSVEREKLNSYINLIIVIAEYLTGQNKLHSHNEQLPQLIYEYINLNYSSKITLEDISLKFGCCKSTLLNSFRQEYGITIIKQLKLLRLTHAAEALQKTNKSIKEISADCGFYDQNHFSKTFLSHYGCLPSEYRKKPQKNNGCP